MVLVKQERHFCPVCKNVITGLGHTVEIQIDGIWRPVVVHEPACRIAVCENPEVNAQTVQRLRDDIELFNRVTHTRLAGPPLSGPPIVKRRRRR